MRRHKIKGEERQGWVGVGQVRSMTAQTPGVTTLLLTGKDDMENETLAKLKTRDIWLSKRTW